jgi:hypothetical protein
LSNNDRKGCILYLLQYYIIFYICGRFVEDLFTAGSLADTEPAITRTSISRVSAQGKNYKCGQLDTWTSH